MAEGSYIERLLRDYANPNPTIAQSNIVCPRVEANFFGIAPFEDMVSNNYRWNSRMREVEKHAGFYELDGIGMLNVKMDVLSKKLEEQRQPAAWELAMENLENHFNFSWGGQQQPPPQPEQRQPAAWELAMEKLVVGTTSRFENIESALDQIATTTRNLEIQMGQLANSLTTRSNGALPSQTDMNSREHCQATILKSVKVIEGSNPKVDLHKAMEHSSIEESCCMINVPKECVAEVSKVCPLKSIDAYIVHSSTDHNEDQKIAAVAHEFKLSGTKETSFLFEQGEPELHNKPPKPPDIKDNLGTEFFSYNKKIRRFLKNQIPNPPFEEGSKKPQVRNQRCYKGNRHRIKHYLVKMLKKVGAYNLADSAD